MKKIIILLLGIITQGYTQNLQSAEYFVDTAPGVGNGIAITGLSGLQSNFTASIPTASLGQGFHTVGIRAKTDDNNWGFYERGMFYISNSTTNLPNIAAAEYFFDTDPGVGLGTTITPITQGQTTSFVATITTAGLTNGFHTLVIRTKDVDGNWGFYERGMVYISNSSINTTNIAAAEYFVDIDPGVGMGTAILPISAGQATNFTASIPTSALTNGFHTLAIRTRDVDGNWGLFEKGMFYVSSSSTNKPDIVAAEYFVDTDPGIGLGSAITPITNGQATSFVANIPTSSLANGFHTIAIRTRDAAGDWGFFEKGMFYISPIATAAGDITKGEYFFDNDPGQGNGFPLTTPVGQSFVQNFALNVPRTLMDGEHIVAIRMFDEWGLTDAKTFTVDGVALPLNLLNFSVKNTNNSANLKWQTANEVNTSHFEIERSNGQINFQKIGKVLANNQKEKNEYDFLDENPDAGLYYYRLKMVDIDGKYSYSPIRSILFKNNESEFTVFPSPADKSVTVDLKRHFSKVKAEIISSIGKEVGSKRMVDTQKFEIDISNLSPGIYIIRISEGTNVKELKFFKR
jgi:hypothetical protein